MKRTMTLLLALIFSFSAVAQRDSLAVMFWNVENFFDWKDGGGSDSDGEFSSNGSRHWTSRRFYTKCNAIAKIIFKASDRYGRLPDAVGLAEVENSFVLDRLLSSTLLRKLDYAYVHYDSPDLRGIDCALLYRKSSLTLKGSSPVHIKDSTGSPMKTRDILLCSFDSLDIIVNHHPSKVGEGSSERRKTALSTLNGLCDSLVFSGHAHILAIGDFNDDIWRDESKEGTIKYHGHWEKIDGFFARGMEVRESVFTDPALLEADKSWGGQKPRRCYVGPRYNGGVSDHCPVVFTIKRKDREE